MQDHWTRVLQQQSKSITRTGSTTFPLTLQVSDTVVLRSDNPHPISDFRYHAITFIVVPINV